VLRLPEPLTADDVIGGGCGLFTGYGAVERSTLAMGDTVVVQGAGPVGLGAVLFAGLRGAGQVIAIGAPAARLELASAFGADLVLGLDGPAKGREEAVRAATNGRGADVVIEASGNPAAVVEGFGMLRDGGTYVVAGHYTDTGDATINPHRHINRKHADVRGQWGTDFHHVVGALRMAARHAGRFPLARAIGARYALGEAAAALAAVERLDVTKAIIMPNA